MAADQWDAGYEFIVTVNGVEYGFKTVDYDAKARQIDRSNSKYSPGFEITKAGAAKLELTLVGPYRRGEIPLVIRGEYEWFYAPNGVSIGKTFFAQIVGMKHGNDVLDGPITTINIVSTDEFDLEFFD